MTCRKTTGRKSSTDIRVIELDEPAPPTPRLALSVSEFCAAHGISEGMYYKLKKQRLAPREMKVGTRTLITFEAAAEWRREREGASAPKVGASAGVKIAQIKESTHR
jgi:hypothetical protein